MSNLNGAAGPDGPAVRKVGEDDQARRQSMNSPSARPGMRRSGTLPAFPAVEEKANKEVDLPVRPCLRASMIEADTGVSQLNPKLWTRESGDGL